MARTKIQHKGDTAKAHGMPFLKLAFSFGLVLVLFVAMGAGAQNLLKGNVTKQIETKPNKDLVDRYGDAANDPAIANVLRNAQGQQTTEELKAKASAYEAIQNGTFKPGADPTMALMYGFVPPNMSPEQAAIMAKGLPILPKLPQLPSPEQMAGMPETESTAIVPSEPYIPYPESFAKAKGISTTRQLQKIPQQSQMAKMAGLPNLPGMPELFSGSGHGGIGYGLSNEEIVAQNQKIAEECIRARFGPVNVPPLHRDHNWLAEHARKTAGGFISESDHQSVVGVCDASGNEITGIQYDPYGNATVLHGGTVMPDKGFKGMYPHWRSGLYLTLARPYSPQLGRWLTRDPLGEGVGTNLYSFCNNDPINYSDPYGLYVVATYSQSKHTLTWYDTDAPDKVYTSSDIFSGNGNVQNNPFFQFWGGHGPIVQGDYAIQPKEPLIGEANFDYPLNPLTSTTVDFFGIPIRRGGFEIHPGLRSNGCVTFKSHVPENAPNYPSNPDFDKLSHMLDTTKPLNQNGTKVPGILTVTP